MGAGARLIDLADWAAWRWAGRPARCCAPPRPTPRCAVLPPARPRRSAPAGPADPLAAEALAAGRGRRAPAAGRRHLRPSCWPPPALGNALVLVPSAVGARHLALRLRRAGVAAALVPRDWAQARAGATVIGTRAGGLGAVPDLAAVVVLDGHDERWQQEQAPTWHARDVAAERARRAGVPCVLVSPAPSLEALALGRAGVAVRARSNGTGGRWSRSSTGARRTSGAPGCSRPAWSRRCAAAGRVVCVLNRKGRARLLACVRCGEMARCERCDAAVAVDGRRPAGVPPLRHRPAPGVPELRGDGASRTCDRG